MSGENNLNSNRIVTKCISQIYEYHRNSQSGDNSIANCDNVENCEYEVITSTTTISPLDESLTANSKPREAWRKKQCENDCNEASSRSWNTYCQLINGISVTNVQNNDNCKDETDAEVAEDIEKWLKARSESISSIEMDPTKSEADEVAVNGYHLGHTLSHEFLDKDPDVLSIDIDLSDKKMALGYDPILQDLQSDKLLDVCEKDGFMLPEFHLDQLDSLALTPNDMVVAGEVLPLTIPHPERRSSIDNSQEFSEKVDSQRESTHADDICDKSTQVNVYNFHEHFNQSNLKGSTNLTLQNDNLNNFNDEIPIDLDNIQTIDTTPIIHPQVQVASFIERGLKCKPKLKPSIMTKKQRNVPDIIVSNDSANNKNEELQNEPNDGIMAVVAISTDKRSNMTQIVINTGKGEQIYQGKTSELMEATGYFPKYPKSSNFTSATWKNSPDNNIDNDSSLNNQELIITNALHELGYSEERLLAVARPENGAWICPHEECHREFYRLYALKCHLLAHFGVRPFKCDYESCNWAFHSEFKLKRHKETHLKRKDYVCQFPGCCRRFTTIYNLWTHQKLHARPNRIICQVPGCDEKFQTRRALELHMKTHDQSHAPYVCSHEGCNKRYFSSNALMSHQRCHSYKEVDITCSWPGCGKVYDKPCRLKAHLRSHTGSKPYSCVFPGCQWAFSSSSKLKRHEKKHTNERKFVCDINGCNKAFMRSEHLREHRLTHNGRFFQCYMCDARFSAKSSLYVHIKKHQTNINHDDHNNTNSISISNNVQSIGPNSNFIVRNDVNGIPDNLSCKKKTELVNRSRSNLSTNEITTPKPKFNCSIDGCSKSYMTKASLRTHTLRSHTRPAEKSTVSPASDMDYIFLISDNETIEAANEITTVDTNDATIINSSSVITADLPEPEPPPSIDVRKAHSSHFNEIEHNCVKKSFGSARTGLTCADVWKLKTKNNITLNSLITPSDIVLNTTDLDEDLLLTEELPSMYYQDDIVGTECQILLLDTSSESPINLCDLE